MHRNDVLKKRLAVTAAVILLAGIGSAVPIYLTAGVPEESVLELSPENSKKYRHDLELYGGKANLLASDLMSWFDGLWHGRQLAYTVACISGILSFGLFFVAWQLPSDGDPEDRGKDNRGGSG